MPTGAVYVGRPTRWGNPFTVAASDRTADTAARRAAHAASVARCRAYLDATPLLKRAVVRELRGKDLACWCPLDLPCHADVLLEVANRVS